MQTVLNNLINEMDQNMKNLVDEDNTYMKDGLKHCKVCNEPLETIINNPFTKEERKVNCICECVVEKLKKEEEMLRRQEKQKEIDKLKRSSLLGDRYKDATFSNTETGINETFDKALIRCRNFCEISSKALENGYGIYLYGDKGAGKTRLTACMCNELVSQRKQVLFTNFFEISKAIRSTFNSFQDTELDMIERITNIDFLFIDDLGTELVKKNGEDNWLQEKIFEVLNKRYNNKKPTIFTSNYSLRELIQDRGLMDKTVDRILEMSTVIMKIEGRSYRQQRKSEIPF